MRLETLTLRRDWRDEKRLCGKAEFAGETGKVELNLTDESARQILNICADSLIEIATLRADDLRAEIIEGQLAIPNEAEDD